jgi:hypothetical protein
VIYSSFSRTGTAKHFICKELQKTSFEIAIENGMKNVDIGFTDIFMNGDNQAIRDKITKEYFNMFELAKIPMNIDDASGEQKT